VQHCLLFSFLKIEQILKSNPESVIICSPGTIFIRLPNAFRDIDLENIRNPLIILPECKNDEGHVWHLFVIRCERREVLQKYLKINSIQTLIHYPVPAHKQKAYRKYNDLSFPITEKIHNEVLSLPISGVISDHDIQTIVKVLNDFNE